MPKASTLKRAASFRRRLLRWFTTAARDLPWRRTRDPWAIVVSEFMLQQTQVARVLEYYDPFLRSYPDPARLARARPAAVREAWDGLGYYRRAVNLQKLAKVILRDYDGRLPSDIAELERLPGIGPYTAGAVACFAYEQPVPAVDTNVARVLSRYFKIKGRKRLGEIAVMLQPRRGGAAAWNQNQGIMELGALICTARKPKCEVCPMRSDCPSRSPIPDPRSPVFRPALLRRNKERPAGTSR